MKLCIIPVTMVNETVRMYLQSAENGTVSDYMKPIL
jgi:hypothetical protein